METPFKFTVRLCRARARVPPENNLVNVPEADANVTSVLIQPHHPPLPSWLLS